ncbi:hypothetical protein A4A49_13100 [Nicotiana attenuata]|uniref:RING-type domain-containing protein n=1 Tax=Nicotiana attenuata TaxID=49451 RepID=A0A314LBH6_NICAT|nr:hypothetical protein A4A49_13100 [Nicotiana attenuata]
MILMCLSEESRSQSNYVSEIARGHEETTERARNMTTERARVVTTEGARNNVITERARARNVTVERAHNVTVERVRNVTTESARTRYMTTESARNVTTESARAHNVTTERARARNVTTERASSVMTERAHSVMTERARNETTERAHSVMTERASNVTIERAHSVTTERLHNVTAERARVMTPERAQETPYLVATIELVIDDFDDGEKIGYRPKIKGKNNDCCICLAEFKQGNMCCLILPACCHRFHVACIIPWLAKNKTCPLCRTRVRVRVVPCPRIDDLLRHSQSLPSSCNDRNCYIISADSILTIPIRPLV